MDELPKHERDAILALLDQALAAETRTEPPPQAELGDWLYGSAGFTEPDEHDWVAPVAQADLWAPRALVFWRMAMLSGAPVAEEQRRDPRHSLARWPTIEAAAWRGFGVTT